MSKLTELENFLLNENSTERKNYEDNLLSGKSGRPEEEFVARHLGRDFWKELGYDDFELGTQETSNNGSRSVRRTQSRPDADRRHMGETPSRG